MTKVLSQNIKNQRQAYCWVCLARTCRKLIGTVKFHHHKFKHFLLIFRQRGKLLIISHYFNCLRQVSQQILGQTHFEDTDGLLLLQGSHTQTSLTMSWSQRSCTQSPSLWQEIPSSWPCPNCWCSWTPRPAWCTPPCILPRIVQCVCCPWCRTSDAAWELRPGSVPGRLTEKDSCQGVEVGTTVGSFSEIKLIDFLVQEQGTIIIIQGIHLNAAVLMSFIDIGIFLFQCQ